MGPHRPSTTQTREAIAAWVALAKRLRPLVATGRTVDVDGTDPGIDVRGHRRRRRSVRRLHDHAGRDDRRLPRRAGPAAGARPRPRATACASLARGDERRRRRAVRRSSGRTIRHVLTGRELAAVGLRPPVQLPQQSTVLELTAEHLTTPPQQRKEAHDDHQPNDDPHGRGARRAGDCADRRTGRLRVERLESGVTTLNFFQFKGEALEDFNKIIADFEAENPDIKVVQNQVADADTIIRTLLVKDKAPDVITLNANGGFGKLAQTGVFYDFSDEPVLQTINPAVQEILAQLGNKEGEVNGLGYVNNANGVIYNQDIFEEQGLEVPETWDEFIAVCDALQDAGITPFYGTLADSWTGLPSFNALGAYPSQGDFWDEMRAEGENVGPDSRGVVPEGLRRGDGPAVRAVLLHAGRIPRQDLRRRQRRLRERRGRDAAAGHLGHQPGQGRSTPTSRRRSSPTPPSTTPTTGCSSPAWTSS